MNESTVMTANELLESYDNDGYVYCILLPEPISAMSLVKIGKIGMKKNESEQQVIDKLLRQVYEVVHFMRTGNYHKAELSIFESLKHLHYRREIYTYVFEDIKIAFEKAGMEYPSIQENLEKADISVISELNKKLRGRDI